MSHGKPPGRYDKLDFISMVNDWHQQKSAILWCACRKEDPITVIGTIAFWKFEFESYQTELGYMLRGNFKAMDTCPKQSARYYSMPSMN
jgi:RimJ/RimL family protein N-acetyltransferase